VGQITIIDSGNTDISSMTLHGTGNDMFDVSADGSITLAAGKKLDYETVTEYNLTAIATNDEGDSNETNVTIHVNDIYDPLLTIVGATYDLNRTSANDDNRLIIYFNKSVDTSPLDSNDIKDCFDINNSGSIAAASTYTYDNNQSHRLVIQLESDSNMTIDVDGITVEPVGCLVDTDGISIERATIKEPLHILQTGVDTISYPDDNASDRDDVHYSMGLDREYSRSNDVVWDGITDLQWQDDSSVTSEEMSQTDAIAYCAAMDLNGTGWRLPTVVELQTIVDYREAGAVKIDATFESTDDEMYWTSTQSVSDTTQAWSTEFALGQSSAYDKDKDYFVRCVR